MDGKGTISGLIVQQFEQIRFEMKTEQQQFLKQMKDLIFQFQQISQQGAREAGKLNESRLPTFVEEEKGSKEPGSPAMVEVDLKSELKKRGKETVQLKNSGDGIATAGTNFGNFRSQKVEDDLEVEMETSIVDVCQLFDEMPKGIDCYEHQVFSEFSRSVDVQLNCEKESTELPPSWGCFDHRISIKDMIRLLQQYSKRRLTVGNWAWITTQIHSTFYVPQLTAYHGPFPTASVDPPTAVYGNVQLSPELIFACKMVLIKWKDRPGWIELLPWTFCTTFSYIMHNLGVQCLSTFGNVVLNLQELRAVVCTQISSAEVPDVCVTPILKPIALLPSRGSFVHRFAIQEGVQPVSIGPYRYPLKQKDIMQELIDKGLNRYSREVSIQLSGTFCTHDSELQKGLTTLLQQEVQFAQLQPELVLDRKMVNCKNRAATTVLVKWCGHPILNASWEFLHELQ